MTCITNTSIPLFWRGGVSPPPLSFPFSQSRTNHNSSQLFNRINYSAALFSIVHYKFIAFNCCKVYQNSLFVLLVHQSNLIFPFVPLKETQKEEVMRFQKRNQKHKSKTPRIGSHNGTGPAGYYGSNCSYGSSNEIVKTACIRQSH